MSWVPSVPGTIFPPLVIVKRVVPEAEAVRIDWSPVSLRLSKALPVGAPKMLT